MKVNFHDSDFWVGFTFIPESIEEVSQLFRLSANASSEKPEIFMSFRNETYCSVQIKKRDIKNHLTSITPKIKNK